MRDNRERSHTINELKKNKKNTLHKYCEVSTLWIGGELPMCRSHAPSASILAPPPPNHVVVANRKSPPPLPTPGASSLVIYLSVKIDR